MTKGEGRNQTKKSATNNSAFIAICCGLVRHECAKKKRGKQSLTAYPLLYMVGRGRLERPTNGLKIHCSTN